MEEYCLRDSGKVLVTGLSVGSKVANGRARVIPNVRHLAEFQAGDILITDMTTPDWGPVMKIAAAIVTNRGGRICHTAIVVRELGIPAVVGAEDATKIISEGDIVTVSCTEGDAGKVYQGEILFDVETTDLRNLSRPTTRITVILGNPELAFKTSSLPNDEVGLARMEFIINSQIKAHSMAMVHPEKVQDAGERAAIEDLVRGYAKPTDYFIERLAEGVGTIAAAFYPKPVI